MRDGRELVGLIRRALLMKAPSVFCAGGLQSLKRRGTGGTTPALSAQVRGR
jgi:hypothetical protein